MNVFEVAIAMEVDLEQYYLEQARINKENSLNKIFNMLADDERKHADILRRDTRIATRLDFSEIFL